MDKKRLRNDIFLIAALLLIATIILIIFSFSSIKKNLIAKVYVQNDVKEVIDLSKKEENDYFVQGTHGEVHIHTYNGGIAIVESNCPHQDCVHIGYVYESNKPIICAYNEVYIIIEGKALNDAELG